MIARPLAAAGLSDVGQSRTHNEDALLIEAPLYAVADGLGGHRAGEVASRIALDTLLAEAPKHADSKALARAIRSANRAVIEAADESHGRSGMGTTLTAVMVDGAHLAIAHVGDSRAYLLHEGRLRQLTQDHSMVADLIRQGSLTPAEARVHPQRSVITRALGSDANMAPDTYDMTAEPGDLLLLCSDGLTTMLEDDRIEALLASAPSPESAAQALVDAANAAGGLDNITVVVVELGRTPAAKLDPAPGSGEARRRVTARLLWVVAALAFVAAAAWGAYSYARSRAFLIDEGGYVAVYRGVPGTFAGLSLAWEVERTDVPVASLEAPVAARLREGIVFTDVRDAIVRAEELRNASQPASGGLAPDAGVAPDAGGTPPDSP